MSFEWSFRYFVVFPVFRVFLVNEGTGLVGNFLKKKIQESFFEKLALATIIVRQGVARSDVIPSIIFRMMDYGAVR